MNSYFKITIFLIPILLFSCYQKVKYSKDLGSIENQVNFKTDKPVHRVMLDSKAEGAEITITVPSKKWSKIYKFKSSDLGKKDSYGMMFHIIDIPKNHTDKAWNYTININGNKEKVQVSYWYFDYPKK